MPLPRKKPRHEWSESHAPETLPLVMLLHHAQDAMFARARPIWARHGLTPAEFDVLATLRNAPPPYELTPTQLQDSVLITSGGLTKVMRQLEERGLAVRSQNPDDQRVKPIRLSREGRKQIERAMAEVTAFTDNWIRSVLDPREIVTLNALLERLVAADGHPPAAG